MNVLLTGGAGYIGSHVCNFLIDNGHEITTIDDLSTGNKKLIPQQAIHLNCDISNVEVISNHLKKNKFDISEARFSIPNLQVVGKFHVEPDFQVKKCKL